MGLPLGGKRGALPKQQLPRILDNELKGWRDRMKKLSIVTAFVLAFAAPVAAQAEKVRVELSGYQETPQSLSTPGFGEFEASISNDGDSISWQLTFGGLPTAVTQAHIHFGQRSIGGGISAWLCGTATNPGPAGTQPCPPLGGTVGGTINPTDVVGPTGQGIAPGELNELIAAIRAGYAYVNIHTTQFPAGEVRGQFKRHGHHHGGDK
jgi:hypothetical protein